jgi:hypothetical protein
VAALRVKEREKAADQLNHAQVVIIGEKEIGNINAG